MRNKLQNKQPVAPDPNSENEQRILEHIRKRAYELWETNGCQPGNDMAHWIEAEREVRAKGGNPRPRAA
jgi:hypothetical protein